MNALSLPERVAAAQERLRKLPQDSKACVPFFICGVLKIASDPSFPSNQPFTIERAVATLEDAIASQETKL